MRVQGAAAITIPAFQAVGSSEQVAIGDAALTLPAFTISSAGTVRVLGTAARSIPALTASAAGAVRVVGAAPVTLPMLTIAGAGSVRVRGTASLSIPAFLAIASQLPPENSGGVSFRRLHGGANVRVLLGLIGRPLVEINAVRGGELAHASLEGFSG